jgi:ubiquinone/menaquinone biosynthesis methyltransferase
VSEHAGVPLQTKDEGRRTNGVAVPTPPRRSSFVFRPGAPGRARAALPAATDKACYVRSMFEAIAGRYDLMNRLMTGGRDEAWRRLTADAVYPEAVRVALDVGAGTGDLALALARRAPRTRVVAVDFAEGMLRRAAAKCARQGRARSVHPLLGDAIRLPVAGASVDAVVTGFTLRNVEDVATAFAEFARVLRPGGRVAILELTPVRAHPIPGFAAAFRAYFHRVVPLVGALVSGRGEAYRYLPASVERFPSADALLGMLRAAGFDGTQYRRLALGTVALHTGEKALEQPAGVPSGAADEGRKTNDEWAPVQRPSSFVAADDGTDVRPPVAMREILDRGEWTDALRRLPNAHALQTWEWGETRRATGWTPRRLLFERDGAPVAVAAVGRRPVPFTGWGFSYCPKGPCLDYADHEVFGQVLQLLARDTRRQRSIVLTVEPDAERAQPGAVAALRRAGYVPSGTQLQYPSTMLVDLRASDEQLLARMSATWRRYVKKAARDGVAVREGTAADVPRFYALYQETAARDGFIIRPLDYYVRSFGQMAAGGHATLFLAEVDGQVEAANVAFHLGGRVWYLWGASSAAAQKAHAPYLLQWHTMQWARDHGCDTYDMWGAPDDPEDTSDSMYGVYYFKRGFGGRHVRWVGPYDYVAAPALYALWTAGLPRALDLLRAVRGERRPASLPRPAA